MSVPLSVAAGGADSAARFAEARPGKAHRQGGPYPGAGSDGAAGFPGAGVAG